MKALSDEARIAHGRRCRKALCLCRQESPRPKNWRKSNSSNAPSALVAHKERKERSEARPEKNPNAGTHWGSSGLSWERGLVQTEFDTLTEKPLRQVGRVLMWGSGSFFGSA
jgi:hypothetical protein